MSDRCPEPITFSQCCKVRLAVLRETALSSAASLSPVEEIELTFGELLVNFVEESGREGPGVQWFMFNVFFCLKKQKHRFLLSYAGFVPCFITF